jgi:hypothetical protein
MKLSFLGLARFLLVSINIDELIIWWSIFQLSSARSSTDTTDLGQPLRNGAFWKRMLSWSHGYLLTLFVEHIGMSAQLEVEIASINHKENNSRPARKLGDVGGRG